MSEVRISSADSQKSMHHGRPVDAGLRFGVGVCMVICVFIYFATSAYLTVARIGRADWRSWTWMTLVFVRCCSSSRRCFHRALYVLERLLWCNDALSIFTCEGLAMIGLTDPRTVSRVVVRLCRRATPASNNADARHLVSSFGTSEDP